MMIRRKIALLHSRTRLYNHRLLRAREIIQMALEMDDVIPYVSLSGGKDSTVVYTLVQEQAGNIPAIWSDDEWWLPETMDYIKRLQDIGLDVRQIRTNGKHTEWFTVKGDFKGIQDYVQQQGWNLCFLGLRKEESAMRRMHLRKYGPLFFSKSDHYWHCNPIQNWTWEDVWAYIYSEDIDYNKAYDRLEEIGIEPERQRIGPLAVERVLGYGQLAILKRGWPDLFNRFAAEHPEAGEYM